ncbi:MAG TPA: hypothetical protein VLB69_08900 [Rudaea sp.]|nr:hypothetical protein [Rudaea sp.]
MRSPASSKPGITTILEMTTKPVVWSWAGRVLTIHPFQPGPGVTAPVDQ